MDEHGVAKILKEAEDWLADVTKNHQEHKRRRERLDRHTLTEHLAHVFENWDEYIEEGSIDPSKIYEWAAHYLREYHDSLGCVSEYVSDIESFRELLVEAIIKYDLKQKIAEGAGVTLVTVQHWALGAATPHPTVREMVCDLVHLLIQGAN